MCKQQIDEINANINEIAEEHAKFLNENNALESEIAQLNVEKQVRISKTFSIISTVFRH